MIYRSWSLLSSTATIWGGAAAAGLAGVFHFGGKEGFQDYLRSEGEKLRRQDRAMMAGRPWTVEREAGPRDNEMNVAAGSTML